MMSSSRSYDDSDLVDLINTTMNASLVLLLAFLPLAAAMTPQWTGLVNGTLIYFVLGAIAMCFVICVTKQAKPCVALPHIPTSNTASSAGPPD